MVVGLGIRAFAGSLGRCGDVLPSSMSVSLARITLGGCVFPASHLNEMNFVLRPALLY